MRGYCSIGLVVSALGGLSAWGVTACANGDGTQGDAADDGAPGDADAGTSQSDSGAPMTVTSDAGLPGSGADGGANSDSGVAAWPDTLDGNRNRLLATYLAYVKANATTPQSNGLSQSNVTDVCSVWKALQPSTQAVYLTLTARMQGSTLRDDSSFLSHVKTLYRVMGGEATTTSAPGSCGGGEYNRMIMSMDTTLHDALLAANADQGAADSTGKFDIADVAGTGSFWRNSQDVGGPHAPFDLSTETNLGAPRGQTQFFKDTTSAAANAALGRMDLTTLVDPLALELDQDYDCPHNSNPLCTYTSYGPLCAPETAAVGVDIYAMTYGDPTTTWQPAGCK